MLSWATTLTDGWTDSGRGATAAPMAALQPDLFGFPQHPGPGAHGSAHGPRADVPDERILALVRTRLHAALALVQGAAAMPWTDMLSVIREDNAFRYAKDLLPPEEGAALWAAFDREMDRLYAVMNEGLELDAGN